MAPENPVQGMPLPTLRLDAAQVICHASDSFTTAFGDPTGFIGQGIDALFDPRDRRGTRGFHRALSRHRGGVLVVELKLKVGAVVPARLYMQALEGGDGWVVSAIDTTPEQEATASLQQARSGLRAILSSMSDGLLVTDAEGTVKDCNQAALGIFRFSSAHGVQLSSEAIVGRPLSGLFDDETAEALTERIQRVSGDPDRIETLQLKHGERSLVANINPIFVPRRGYQGACITVRDLTEIERLHGDMRRVLDNVQQGLLTVDLEGHIASERSAIFETWVGDCPEGTSLFAALSRLCPETAEMLELGWEQLSWGMLPLELCLGQLPSTLRAAEETFALSYEPIFAEDELERVLVVMTNITEAIRREAAEALQKESIKAFESLNKDRAGFLAFHRDAERILSLVRDWDGSARSLPESSTPSRGTQGSWGWSAWSSAATSWRTAWPSATVRSAGQTSARCWSGGRPSATTSATS